MTVSQKRAIRCAIYTRKSSEEGLEQSFNSLDAQREACQAYILSQRQEGWRALDTHYDDGGYSGGSIDRPALQCLLADIEARKVDTVVVYKVDRLTRSLADFAKIIEAFDARGVSFVSVTQQFNTTSSMGRLTLNVLLSFAQFEREVTGERIRDKIAASKRKGMWMGGSVPLGYDLKDRRLIVNQGEAGQVRQIFQLYVEFGCVRKLKEHLEKTGVRSKIRISRLGRRSGGGAHSRGALYKILGNRIYLGKIPHKENSYPGEHEAIIDQQLWQQVHTKMAENVCVRRHGRNASAPSLLRGLLYDREGHRFTPSHAVKNGKRYRYYVLPHIAKDGPNDEPDRIPAQEIENLIISTLREFFGSPDQVMSSLARPGDDVAITRELVQASGSYAEGLNTTSAAQLNEMLTEIMLRATVLRDSVGIQFSHSAVRSQLLKEGEADEAPPDLGDERDWITLEVLARLKRCGGETRLIIPGPAANDQPRRPIASLVKAVSRAYDWVRKIESGEFKDQRAIATAYGINERYISHILPGAFLAPTIVEAILEGKHSPDLSLNTLLKDLPLNWTQQRLGN